MEKRLEKSMGKGIEGWGKRIEEKEVKEIGEKEGKRDWREGREKVLREG